MRITVVEVENYKRISEKISITPPDEHCIIYISGPNRSGKSSFIDAITNALGGKGEDPIKPIHEGKEFADIRIKLIDDVEKLEYEVHKRFLKNGSSSLTVTGRDGKISSPQKLLNKIVSARFLDPLKWARSSDKEQRASVLGLMNLEIDLDEWDASYKVIFSARTEYNRDAKKFKIELESSPHPGEIEKENTTNLSEKLSELTEENRAREKIQSRLDSLRTQVATSERRIEELKTSLKEEEQRFATIMKEGAAERGKWDATKDVTKEIEGVMAEIETSNERAAIRSKGLVQLAKHETAKDRYEAASTKATSLSDDLAKLVAAKEYALGKAEMPISGLSISDDGLLYKGIPFSQASGADQLEVSLALAAAMSPNLEDIWIKDGSLLDENSLKTVNDFASGEGLKIWVERVGKADEGAIIIEDGGLIK